jgi:hypothetical protein
MNQSGAEEKPLGTLLEDREDQNGGKIKGLRSPAEENSTHSPWWYTSSSSRYLYFEAGECWWDNEYGFCGSSTNVIDPQRTVHSGFS